MQGDVRNELAVSVDEEFLTNYKSMYYMLNAKPDSISRAYSKRAIVDRDSLIDLNNRVKEKIRMNYDDDGYIATVTVNFSNKRCIDFKCWDEFLHHAWNENYCVDSIILKWNFNIRIPQFPNPQNHNLVVKITNGLRFEEMMNFIFSGHMENFNEMEMETSPIIARIDFINPLLGEELLNIVGEWADGLETNEFGKNKIVLLARKYRTVVARTVEYVSFVMFCLLGVSLLSHHIKSIGVGTLGNLTMLQFSDLLKYIVVFGMTCSIFKKISYIVAKNIHKGLEDYGDTYTFMLTRGDEKQQKSIQKEDRKQGATFIAKLIASGIFNIVCGIISSLLVGGM